MPRKPFQHITFLSGGKTLADEAAWGAGAGAAGAAGSGRAASA